MAEEKKVKFCDKDYDLDTGVCEFNFGDGEQIVVNVDELPADIQRQLTLHGMCQKGGDSYAGAKGNYAEAKANLRQVIANLASGSWGSAGEGEGKPKLGELSQAIARIKGIDLTVATAAVEKADDAKRKEWRAHPKIKAAIAQLRAEKAQAELDKAEATELDIAA